MPGIARKRRYPAEPESIKTSHDGLFPFPEEQKQAQGNLNQGGQGGCQADVEQGGPFQPLDEKHRRNPHKEGADDPLHHDKDGFSEAVEVTYEAEKHGGEQAVDGVGLQIVVGIGNHLAVPGEEGG